MFQSATVTLSVSVLAAITVPVVLVLVLMVCLSCLKKKTAGGFSNISNSADATNTTNAHVNNSFTVDIEDTNVDSGSSTGINLEPLPDITSKLKLPTSPLRPRIGCVEKAKSDASLKLIVAHKPFPRGQITYLKELGSGWFGKVIESDAENITTGVARTKVVVKMLKDDASKDEQQLFFEEVTAFRELEHPNIMRLLGQCTEINPILMIVEYAAFGNLKQYLRNHRHEQASLIHKNRLIQFALDASSGLACLHGHDYLHKDLAARNCLVMTDHTLKIGDYGIAEDLFKEDYLSAGSNLLPIRWMAPETLKQDSGRWTSSEFSKESDIWSLGVVLWEIAMLGERPYDMLTDEAVLQGVITDKDIRLPEPDIGMPNKDRLYEVMRFCWMDPPDRLKVDEVYKLLEQIASKAPEEGASSDAITAFEQKWEHLMPNQRHESVDSVDDQQGSISSDDFNILDNSLEDLTAAGAQDVSPPLAPPRASRRKLSVRKVTIPTVDDDVSEGTPVADKERAKEPFAVPQVNIIDEAGHKIEVPQLPEESKKPEKSKESSSSELEFTEFTSHSTDEEGGEETPNVSQIESGPAPQDKTLPEKMDTQKGEAGDSFEVDALSKVRETLEDDSLTFNTPDRPQAQVKARKTSTPVAKDEASPSSSSSLSGGDSSETFVTAPSSSPSNLTDAYNTASDSTLVTGKATAASSEASGDSSMKFEILDTTAVPSVFSDSSQSEEDSRDTKVSNPFSPANSSNKNPFTDDGGSIAKDDGFGEFTNGSLVDESDSSSPKSSAAPSVSATFSSSTDTSATQNEFFNIIDESSEKDSKSQTDEADKPDTQEADPFVSFGTDFSSLSSLNVPKAAQSADQEQVFPSFSSDFSALDSLNTDSTPTPQAEAQSDIFAFDTPSPPQESQQNVSGLEMFSSDLISSSSSKGTDELSTQNDAGKEDGQAPPDLSANLSSIPLDSSSTFASDSGHHSGTQQPTSDPFGLGDPEPNMQDSSFEFLQAQDSTKASMSSSAFSDFDFLSSFSTVPASSASPSNPFAGGGDLLQELSGSSSAADPAPAQKESQDGVLVAGDSTDPSKSSEAAFLDFSAFESAGTEDAPKQDEGSTEKTTSEASTASSLIDI